MVAGYVIRKQRLNIHDYSAAELQDSYALIKHSEELAEIRFPVVGVAGFLVAQSKVVRRRSEHQVNTIVRSVSGTSSLSPQTIRSMKSEGKGLLCAWYSCPLV